MKIKENNVEVECLTPNQKFIKMWRADIERNGKHGILEFVSRKEIPEAISGKSEADAVIIIPFIQKQKIREVVFAQEVKQQAGSDLPDGFLVTLDCGHKIATRTKELRYRCPDCETEDNCFDELLVIKEFRYPINDYVYSFPAGIIDPGENPITTASRELSEETGYQIDEIIAITPPVYSSTGLTDESTIFVYAYVSKAGPAKLEGMEDIELAPMGKAELTKLVNREAPYENARISCKVWPIAHSLVSSQPQMV